MSQIKGTIEKTQTISGKVGDNKKSLSAEKIIPAGPRGKDGLSAYELAVKNGYKGTEKHWLETHLKRDELELITQQEATTDIKQA